MRVLLGSTVCERGSEAGSGASRPDGKRRAERETSAAGCAAACGTQGCFWRCEDVRITYPEHCGNSPKKVQLIDLHKAIINGDASFLLASLSSDVVLNVVGESVIVGRENDAAAARDVVSRIWREIRIKDAITPGQCRSCPWFTTVFEGKTRR